MKIDRAAPVIVEPLQPRAEAPQKAEAATVVTTGEHERMRSIAEEAKELVARERSQRLSDVKSQLAAGLYRPDPSRIADQILREAEMSAQLRSMLR